MRVFRVRARREADRFVARAKLDIEPGDERMDEIVAAAVEGKRCGEGQVGGGAGVQVEG